MNHLAHFQLMANYNQRLNQQIADVLSHLSKDIFWQDDGAFFGSIAGSLNHILVADLLWLGRFASHQKAYQNLSFLQQLPKPSRLDQLLFHEFDVFKQQRFMVDAGVIDWLKEDVREDDFHQSLTYSNSKGVSSRRDFGEVVAHFFNHQTHHRGQVSTLLSQRGLDVGVTDFLVDIPNEI